MHKLPRIQVGRFMAARKKSIRYSSLKQVNTTNVKQLQVAWTYHTADAEVKGSQMQCNPIIVNGILYGSTPHLSLIALDAATGEQKWIFKPETYLGGKTNLSQQNNRGLRIGPAEMTNG
jgi:quinoprotein glucose dehydrogenase